METQTGPATKLSLSPKGGSPLKIAGKKVLSNSTFLLGSDEEAEILVPISEKDNLRVVIVFKPSDGDQKSDRLTTWSGDDKTNTLRIVCKGWNEQLASGMPEPAVIGEINGESISFFIATMKPVPKYRIVCFQVLLGGEYAGA